MHLSGDGGGLTGHRDGGVAEVPGLREERGGCILAVAGGAGGDLGSIYSFGRCGVGDLLGMPPEPLLDDEHDPEQDDREEEGDLDGRHPPLVALPAGHGAQPPGCSGVGMLFALLCAAG